MSAKPDVMEESQPESQPAPRRDGEAACVVASLAELNANTCALSKHILDGMKLHKESLDHLAKLASEVQRTVSLTQAIMETFVGVRQDLSPKETSHKGGSVSRTTDVTDADQAHPIDVDDLEDVEDPYFRNAAGGLSTEKVMGPPKGRGSWTEDTIMVGATLNVDYRKTYLTPVAPSAAARGKGVMNCSMRGQLSPNLGDPMGTPQNFSASSMTCASYGRMPVRSVEDMKRSGKIKRGPREPRPVYGSAASRTGVVFPTYIHCYFNINKGMKLSLEKAQAIAYIFGKSMNPNETLFKRGKDKLEREDFRCILPGNEPSDYIMQLMAQRTSWTQSMLPQRSVWSLPVYFSELVLDGNVDYSQLISFFAKDYMPHPNALRYIYVQMKDTDEVEKQPHFYLMVVELQLGKIWIMDTFPTDDSAIPRKYACKSVATALDHILKTKYPDVDVLGRRPPLGDWNPEYALGIPNVGNCYKDKLWVLLWLQMEQHFSLNPPGKKKNNIDELSTKIRLDTALNLAADPFNMMEDEFMQRAAVDWTTRGTTAAIQG